MRQRCPRVRRAAVTPEEWTRHRKLRKKIASARWYAKRKRAALVEQAEHRQRLEAEHRQRHPRPSGGRLWTDAEFWYWKGVLARARRGYPARPADVPAERWCEWIDRVEAAIERSRPAADALWRHIPWDDPAFPKILRQLGMRECRSGGQFLETCSVSGVVFAGLAHRSHAFAKGCWPTLRPILEAALPACHHSSAHTSVHTPHPAVGHSQPRQHPPTHMPVQNPIPNAVHNNSDTSAGVVAECIVEWIQEHVFRPPPPLLDPSDDPRHVPGIPLPTHPPQQRQRTDGVGSFPAVPWSDPDHTP